MSIKSLVKQVLVQQQNKRYERLLRKKKISYDEWIRTEEKKTGCREAGTESVPCENDEFVFFLQSGVAVAEYATEWIAEIFRLHPEVVLIYGDEDVKETDGTRVSPWFKPAWSPELFKQHFYFGGLVAVRKTFAGKREGESCTKEEICDCVVRAGGYRKGCRAIYHLPRILCHNTSEDVMQKWLTEPNAEDMVSDWNPSENMISVIIPSKDHPELLRNCFEGILKAAADTYCEILVVDNGSAEENKVKTQALATEFEKSAGQELCGVRYIYEPMEFNFSFMCNLGASQARGNLYLFLNDDVKLCEGNTLKRLAELALPEYAGAVGLKLLYPDSERIQHAGITNLPMGPVHKMQFLDDKETYYYNSNRSVRNVIGVTAACMMVQAVKFAEVKGFSKDLKVAFNDVDLCFKLYEAGYHNACENALFAYHYESLSRGDDESTEKWMRLMQERTKLYENHPDLEGKDPYFGFGLAREGLDSRIRAAYEIAGNKVQSASIKAWKLQEKDCRRDNCLMVRVEECVGNKVSGYAVVLGDNNACYEFELLLKHKETSEIYAISLEGQYRPDLEENMPDQINVGLCGFAAQIKDVVLPVGEYHVGMVARNRLSGVCLLNFSSRILRAEKR